MKKNLNMKNMVETLVNYSGEQDELNRIWDNFHAMACMGFISDDLWKKFYTKCKGWYIDENCLLRDMNDNDRVIYDYSCGVTFIL